MDNLINILPPYSLHIFMTIMIILHSLDAWTTYTGLKLSKDVEEKNFILKFLFKYMNKKNALFLLKTVILIFTYKYFEFTKEYQIPLLLIYTAVFVWNFNIVNKIKKQQ